MLVMCFAGPLWAKPNITAGTFYLQPNQAAQQIEIYVSGGDLVQGLEFNMKIADGLSGPLIEGVDILTGTIFASSNKGIFPGSYLMPRTAYQGTTAIDTLDIGYGAGKVKAAGLLATLTLDTTGLFTGQYALSFSNIEGNTTFADIPADITNGLIVVPEPASLAAILIGGVMLAKRRKR